MEADVVRVLVVDDEPDMCWALEHTLRSIGCVVMIATTGTQALDWSARTPCVVAFVDAKLPDVDGLELASLIHRQSPNTEIVLISGYFYQEDPAITEGLQQNLFVGFIAKPFQLDEVRAMARQAIASAMHKETGDGTHSDHR